jgi:hypothetical protein
MSREFLKTTREAGSASLALPPGCLAGLDIYWTLLSKPSNPNPKPTAVGGMHTPKKRQFGRRSTTMPKEILKVPEENESCGV